MQDAEPRPGPIGLIVAIAVAIAINYAVFLWVIDSLRSIGGRHGVTLVRIFVVALDVWLVYFAVTYVFRIPRRAYGAIGAVALAALLHFTGVLDRVRWSSSRLPAAYSGILEARRLTPEHPQASFHEFAGDWRVTHNMFGPSWISRVRIEVKGGSATATLWRACGNKRDCDAGTYDARFETGKPGQAHALHIAGHTAGWDWLASMIPSPHGMLLSERHIRGTNWDTHSQQMPQLKRVGP
jgi:hypothetical protein